MAFLAFLFFVTALLYASVGFGGGSTYNALLVLHGTDYRVLPAIALVCNIIVVAGGVWRFGRAGHIDIKRILPFIISSIPLAWLGGRLPVSEMVFVGLLGAALLIAGIQLLFTPQTQPALKQSLPSAPAAGLFFGGALGFLAGVVGIGGGIFLAPVLYLMRWGTPRQIAGTCSFFILVNSASGLAGQLSKLSDAQMIGDAFAYWLVLPAVFLGGQIGSRLGAMQIPEIFIKRLTAVLMVYVSIRLLLRWSALAFS